jgi:hypothetical protein
VLELHLSLLESVDRVLDRRRVQADYVVEVLGSAWPGDRWVGLCVGTLLDESTVRLSEDAFEMSKQEWKKWLVDTVVRLLEDHLVGDAQAHWRVGE